MSNSKARNKSKLKPPEEGKKRPGAPKGNKNALKHGLYAWHYTPSDRADLGAMPPLDSMHEIYMLRAQLDDILSLLERCEDEDRRVKLYNSLFTGTQRLLSAMRTHNIIVGDSGEVLTDFWQGLKLFQKEVGLKANG